MNRTVSSILILMLLVSQSLFSVPHSHAGSSIVEPDGHAVRPHFHLHGHSHRDHHHGHDEDERQSDEIPLDHDEDAVYSVDIQLLDDGKDAKIAKLEIARDCVIFDDATGISASYLNCLCHDFPIHSRNLCALYLQLQSIRC